MALFCLKKEKKKKKQQQFRAKMDYMDYICVC